MDVLQDSHVAQPTAARQPSDGTDPLVEQMHSVLRLARPRSTPSHKERRCSDADRPRSTLDTTTTAKPNSVAVLSRDGSRWLPAPDEQQHLVALDPPTTVDAQISLVPATEPHRCHSAICSIRTVFATPELLELILSFLDTKEILSLQRTNNDWQATISASPRLRLHLFILGQWNRPAADFRLLPLTLPGLKVCKGKSLHLGQWISVTLTPDAARYLAPRTRPQSRVRSRSIFEGLRGGLGPRAKAAAASDAWSPARTTAPRHTACLVSLEELLVTQPPLVGMQAHVMHSNTDGAEVADADTHLPACAKLSLDTGITLGFLAETAMTLFNDAESSSKTQVDRVMFRAIMSFCAPDESPKKRIGKKIVTRLGT